MNTASCLFRPLCNIRMTQVSCTGMDGHFSLPIAGSRLRMQQALSLAGPLTPNA